MPKEQLISVSAFCTHFNIDHSFIIRLVELDCVQIIIIENEDFLSNDDLATLERMIRIKTEFGVNPEGLEIIEHLLTKVMVLQEKVSDLEEQLTSYQD